MRHWDWIFLVGIFLLVAIIRLRLLGVPLERDEGEYAYAGQLILHGVLPYDQAYNMKMPGIYAAYAVILALFGQTHHAIHAGVLLINLLSALFLFLLARDLLGRTAGVAAAAFFALLSASSAVLGLSANAEHFVLVFALPGILLTKRSLDAHQPALLACGALLLGLAFLMKQHGAAFIAFMGLYVLVRELTCRPCRPRRLLLHGALYLIGVAFPFALCCAVLAWGGVFHTFWFWTFDYAREYVRLMPLSHGLPNLKHQIGQILRGAPLVWLFLPAGLIWFLRRKAWKLLAFVAAFLLFSFLAVCPGWFFREHYFLLLLPALALLAGAGAKACQDLSLRLRPKRPAPLLPLIAALVALAHYLWLQRVPFFQATPLQVSRLIYGLNPFPEALELGRYLREHTRPGDRIAILGSEPEILFYARRRSPTGYIYAYPLLEPQPYALRMQEDMIRQIEAAPPEYLIFVQCPLSWLGGPDSPARIFDWLNQFQPEHYQPFGVIDILGPQNTRYLWGDALRGYEPQSPLGIRVFKRKAS